MASRFSKLLNHVVIASLLWLLSACSPDSTPQQQTTKIEPAAQQQWIAGWQQTSNLSIARAGAATVVNNGFIYVIGGVDGRIFLALTEYAKINEDGSLTSWQRGPDLIEDRGFIDAVVYNNNIYVVGGGNGPNGHNLLRSVERAPIKADGSLGQWQKETQQMVLPRRCTKLVLVDDTVYSLGGFGGALLDSVEYAKIMPDGHLSQWTMADNTLTIPRYVNTAKGTDSNIYVLGGHDQMKGVGITDVEWSSSDVKQPGANVWRATSSLNTGRYGLTSAKHGKTIYAIGGLTGLEYLNSIEAASIDNEGGLNAWRFSTALPEPRATFNALVYKDWIYIIGGTNQDTYLNSVIFAGFNSAGDIGFWGSAQQAESYQQQIEAKKISTVNLPNEGTVIELQHASMYSYIRVNSNNGDLWIAGPKTELNINDKIRFSKGVSMSKFFSKELQRSFPVILFVSKIQRVDK